jgi:hypothetical protein
MAWWKKALLALSLLAIWLCGLLLVGSYGYQSQYFWVSLSVLSIGFAVAPFWRFRSSNWYWPTIAVLGLVHVAALYFERTFTAHHHLPPKGLVQGMLVVDCMASWSIMVGVCWIVTRRLPWQLSDQ